MSEETFQCFVTRPLRARGIVGPVAWVRVNEVVIDITGTEGGQVRLRVDDIARVRIGYVDAKTRTYEARVWPWGDDVPVRLVPATETWAGYGACMRLVATALLSRQRHDRIELGASRFDAVFGPAMMGLLAVAAIGVSIVALENEPWWGRLLVPAIPTVILAALLRVGMMRYWPRPLVHPSELDAYLPPTRRA